MNVRQAITDLLGPLDSRWPRIKYPANDMGPATYPIVSYWTDTVSPPLTASAEGRREVKIALGLWTIPLNEKAEDGLDDALEQVLDLLDAAGWLTYEPAARSTWGEKYTGYTITLTAYTTPED